MCRSQSLLITIIIKFIECLIVVMFSYLILTILWARYYYFLRFTHEIKEAKRLNVLFRVLYPECSRLWIRNPGWLAGWLPGLQPTMSSWLWQIDSKLVSLQCPLKPSLAKPLSSGHRIKLWKCTKETTLPAGPDLGKGALWTKCIQPTNVPLTRNLWIQTLHFFLCLVAQRNSVAVRADREMREKIG